MHGTTLSRLAANVQKNVSKRVKIRSKQRRRIFLSIVERITFAFLQLDGMFTRACNSPGRNKNHNHAQIHVGGVFLLFLTQYFIALPLSKMFRLWRPYLLFASVCVLSWPQAVFPNLETRLDVRLVGTPVTHQVMTRVNHRLRQTCGMVVVVSDTATTVVVRYVAIIALNIDSLFVFWYHRGTY